MQANSLARFKLSLMEGCLTYLELSKELYSLVDIHRVRRTRHETLFRRYELEEVRPAAVFSVDSRQGVPYS